MKINALSAVLLFCAGTFLPATAHSAWIYHSPEFGYLETSDSPYYYSTEERWFYTSQDPVDSTEFWLYDLDKRLGWLYYNAAYGGWLYAVGLPAWVYPGGSDRPGEYFLDEQWMSTPEKTTYYVSADSGSDDNPGTWEAPFATIGKAIGLVDENDTISVRAGHYREQLRPATAGSRYFPITLEAYSQNGVTETVVVSAYEVVEEGVDGLGTWSDMGNGLYRIQLPFSFGATANQLQVKLDNESLVDARWPNVDSNFAFFREDMASADSVELLAVNGSTHTVRYHNSELGNLNPTDWIGGFIYNLQGKQWTASDASITDAGDGYVQFDYTINSFGGEWNRASQGDIFYLAGRKAAIDQPGEYFHDVFGRDGPARALWLQFPEGKTPANSVVELKSRTYGMSVTTAKHWLVRNIEFDAGVIQTIPISDSIVFDGVTVMDFYSKGFGVPSLVELRGPNNVFKNGRIDGSTRAGIMIDGRDITVENNVILNAFLNGIDNRSGARNVRVVNNTVANSGGASINLAAKGSSYLRNRAYHAGRYITDIAVMNAWGTGDLDGSEVAYNVVHDNLAILDRNRDKAWNGGFGIRTDSGGGAGVSNISIHHNVVYNVDMDGISAWGLEPSQPNVGNAMIDVYNNSTGPELQVQGNGGSRSAAGVFVGLNYADSVSVSGTSDPGIVFEDNFSITPDLYGTTIVDPRFFNADANDYRLLPDSPLDLNDGTYAGAIAPGTVFPVAGAIWNAPDASVLSAGFIETFGSASAIGISGMPRFLHLPDGAMIRVDGTVESNDMFHRYDADSNRAVAVFLVGYFETPAPVDVEISFDKGATWNSVGTVELFPEDGEPAEPAPFVYEGFTDASNPLENSAGGFGWESGEGWAEKTAGGGVVDGSSPAVVASGNLAAPLDYVYFGSASSETDPDGSFIFNILDASAPTGNYSAARHFNADTMIDLGLDAVYYFSFLWIEEISGDGVGINQGGTGNGGKLEVDFLGDGTHSRRIWEFTTADGEIFMDFGNEGGIRSNPISFTPGESYLLVGKVEAYADELIADVVSVSIFESGASIGSEPTDWTISGEILEGSDRSRLIDRIGLKGSGSLNQFDELRIGNSFFDVTGIPSTD